MLTLAFRFPAGRYHATPWGHHVNEADLEWPPSPWRILRALIATWHRKLDPARFPENRLRGLVHVLAEAPPEYFLPQATRSHSRHYMPVREGKKDKSVLVFDAFARIDPHDRLIACWPLLDLDDEQLALLSELAKHLGFLGRAESWVEAARLPDWQGETNCKPSEISVDTASGEALEPVRLIAPVRAADYSTWREQVVRDQGLDAKRLTKTQQRVMQTLPTELIGAMQLESGEIQQAGWSCPPGARFLSYQRPYASFSPRPGLQFRSRSRPAPVTTARIALWGKPKPRIQDALRIGELVRIAALHQAGKLFEQNAIPAVLSGHGLAADNRHGHVFFLPEDADKDGHIDHVVIHARDGLPGKALRALENIQRLWQKDGTEWQVLFEQYGDHKQLKDLSYLQSSREWISATPYLHPWHRKKNFSIEDQIRRECRERGLAEPELQRLSHIGVGKAGKQLRPVHFHRFRSRRGLTQPDTQGSFWTLTFPNPIEGPLALGFACHYGLGLFVPTGTESGS